MAIRVHAAALGKLLVASTIAVATAAACSGGAADRGDASAFCDLLEGSIDTVGLDAGVDRATLDAFVEVAPTEIRDDLEVVVAASDALAELERADADPDQIAEVGEMFGSAQFATASRNIEEFAVASCDVEASDFEGGD